MIYRNAPLRAATPLMLAAALSLSGCSNEGKPEPIRASESPVETSALTEAKPDSAAAPAPAATAPISLETSTSAAVAPPGSPEPLSAPADTATSAAPVASAAVEPPRSLEEASSPYLRAALQTKVTWNSWHSDAFRKADTENRPVLISIGAGWSHACKSMDQTTYSDPEVAAILNEQFVTIRVDRDERPDLDERYQAAYALINRKAGGYPLTIFALPDGRPFEAVGFVPAESTNGKAGMRALLGQVVKIYTERNEDARKMADLVERSAARPAEAAKAALNEDLIHRLQAAVAKEYDPKSETFGSGAGPRFPAGSAVLALLHYYSDYGDSAALKAATDSLSRYFRSGLRDNVMGGYFRYADDPELQQPRFEKLLPVQAEMLSAHAHAYAATGKYLYKEAANDVLRFVRDTFEAPDGGFYASQDADLGAGDDGSYYQWSAEEVEKIAGDGKDVQVFLKYLNVPADSRGPLFPTSKMQAVADALKVSREDAVAHLDNVRDKLHEARMSAEKAPYVNKTLIASWNSAMIGAYLDAYKYLGDTDCRDFALKSAARLMQTMISNERGVARTYAKGQAGEYGVLEDNVRVADALIQCFEVSGRHEYLDTASSLMEYIEARFTDPASGLYLDRIDAEAVGLLKVGRHPVADGITPAANAQAALTWYRLYQLDMKPEYQQRAERLVSAAAAQPGLDGISAATLARAASVLINGAPKILVVGPPDDPETQKMHAAALPVFRMGKLVEVLAPEKAEKTDYKPSKDGKPITYVCTVATCAPPVRDAAKVADVVRSFAKPTPAEKAEEEVRTADSATAKKPAKTAKD